MGAVAYQAVEEIDPLIIAQAYLCCQCGLCGMYACPTMLSPDRIIKGLVGSLKASGAAPLHKRKRVEVHPERDYRRTPIPNLISRLELEKYDVDAPMMSGPIEVDAVSIPLKQHVGVPCTPLVKAGETVKAGQIIGDVPEGQLGAPIHASISGVVSSVTAEGIGIRG